MGQGRHRFKMMEFLSALAVAASVEWGCAPGAEPASEALEIALVDFSDLPALAVRVLQSEARAILAAPRGRDLGWRRREPQEEIELREVAVLLLAGEHPVRRSRGAVLGGVEPRAVHPAVWVYPRTVERVVGLARISATADPVAQRALGLALGRVVAHELVHVMAPELRHATAGLMAPAYDRQALAGPRPRLDPVEAATYRAGLERWLNPQSTALRPEFFRSFTRQAKASDRHASWRCPGS